MPEEKSFLSAGFDLDKVYLLLADPNWVDNRVAHEILVALEGHGLRVVMCVCDPRAFSTLEVVPADREKLLALLSESK